MLTIKLSRVGKKKQPQYRVVVLEKARDPWGVYLENVGFYNPKAQPKVINLNAERIKYWISKGAQPSTTLHNLFVSQGIIEATKRRNVTITNKRREKLAEKKKAEAAKTEAAPAA